MITPSGVEIRGRTIAEKLSHAIQELDQARAALTSCRQTLRVVQDAHEHRVGQVLQLKDRINCLETDLSDSRSDNYSNDLLASDAARKSLEKQNAQMFAALSHIVGPSATCGDCIDPKKSLSRHYEDVALAGIPITETGRMHVWAE